MSKRKRKGSEQYHDRVANIYDGIYEGSPYWEFYFTITWRHIKKHLPERLPCRVLDVGCGAGRWGLKLIKSGYQVDFLDISQKMLDQVGKRLDENPPKYVPNLIHADICNLTVLPEATYDCIIGQGDPLSHAGDSRRALEEMTRLLKPGGIMIQSVDNKCAAIDFFIERADLQGLRKFAKDGVTHWLTADTAEQFPVSTFTPSTLRTMFERQGYEVLSLIGKTILPIRSLEGRAAAMMEDVEKRQELIRIEEDLHSEISQIGRAGHLEIVARLGAAVADAGDAAK